MKTKLIILLLIMASLAAYGFLGTGYLKQRQGQAVLASSITDTSQELKQVPTPPTDLESRLAAAQARLTAAQSAFPGKPNSTQIINKILKLADECQVKAIPLSTQEWSPEKTRKGYLVFRLHMTVKGDFPQFVNFVGRLENGEFETLIIESLSVTRLIQKAEENAIPEQTLPITAGLDVAIYARSTDAD